MPRIGTGSNRGMTRPRGPAVATLLFNHDLTAGLPANFTVSRANGTTATYVNSSGAVAQSAANTARFDFLPLTLAARGLLVEPLAVDVITDNNNLANTTPWNPPSNATLTQATSITAPDGAGTSWKLTQGSTNNVGSLLQYRTTAKAASALPYSFSVYVKAAENSIVWLYLTESAGLAIGSAATYNLSTGTITGVTFGAGFTSVTTKMTPVGNGWYRCEINATSTTAATISAGFGLCIVDGDTTPNTATLGNGAYFWRPVLVQTDEGPSSVIYSTGAGALTTRSADDVGFTTASVAGYVQGSGSRSLWAQIGPITTQRQQTLYSENDGTASNRIDVIRNTSQQIHVLFVSGGVTQADLSMGTAAAGNTIKLAFGWTANSFHACMNGGAIVSSGAGTAPTGLTVGNVGRSAISTEYQNAATSRIKGWDAPLTDAELANETQLPPMAVLAFPGAVGFGRFATGGRGGTLRRVTNLNDSGSGSFRAAVAVNGPATVVFDVGGYITLASDLIIAGDLTIAGETAPSPGICFREYTLLMTGANVIMRHVHVRIGANHPTSEQDGVGFGTYPGRGTASNCILDHCTMQWGADESLSFTNKGQGVSPTDITIMNCTIAESVYVPDPTTGLGVLQECPRVTYYRNFLGYNDFRNPECTYENNLSRSNQLNSAELTNNLFFGNRYEILLGDGNLPNGIQAALGGTLFSIINNYSPNISTQTAQGLIRFDNGDWATTSQAQVYHSGNVVGSGRGIFTNNNTYNPIVGSPPLSSNIPAGAIIPADATLQSTITKNVGSRPNNRDTQITGMFSRVSANNAARQTTIAGYGGFPSLTSTAAVVFVDPPNPNSDDDGDGWTNREEVLHQLAAALLNP